MNKVLFSLIIFCVLGTAAWANPTIINQTICQGDSYWGYTQPGTYLDTFLDVNNVDSIVQLNLTIDPLPTFGVITNATNNNICAGTPLILTGIGTNSFGWSNGVLNGVSFMPSGNNTYTVTGVNSNGCQSTSVITINIVANPVVTVTALPGLNICPNAQATLTAAGAPSITWSGGVTNGIAFTPASQAYTVIGKDLNNCSDTVTVTLNVVTPSALAVTAVPISFAVCAGQAITLNAIGGANISWSNSVTNGVAFTPATSGIYTVTGNTTNNCPVSTTVNVIVSNGPSLIVNSFPANTQVCSGDFLTLNAGGSFILNWSGGITNSVPFIPVASGIYTVSGTDNYNCSASSTIQVTVHANPAVAASITPNGTVCRGTPLILQSSGAQFYTWANAGVASNVSFAANTSTIYTVTGTDVNGCTGVSTVGITVINNIIPTIGIHPVPNQTVPGAPVTYVATINITAPYSINWYRNNVLEATTSNTTWATTMLNGANSVYATISSPIQCLEPDSATSEIVEIFDVTSIDNNISKHTIKVYPNPATNNITVANVPNNATVQLIDAMGKLYYSNSASNNVHTINCSELACGSYFVKVQSGTLVEIQVVSLVK
jgi:hypothetical protein